MNYKRYIKDVTEGNITVNKYVRLAVQRHLDDLERDDLVFDEVAANVHVLYFHRVLKHSKGEWAGSPFTLLDWQAFIVSMLFGWKNLDGTRRFNKMYLEVARKNGKTALGAGISLMFMNFLKEEASEVYYAATTRKQAKLGFDQAKQMVMKSPALKQVTKALSNELRVDSTNSKAEPVSSEAGNLDGLSVHFALIDEYHAHKNADVYNVLASATGARREPLIATITTAGFNLDGPCMSMRKAAEDMLEGKITDDATLALIYCLDREDDYSDSSTWAKANPSMGHTFNLDYLEKEFITSKNNGNNALHNFKTKHLNEWVYSEDPWIDDEAWVSNKSDWTPTSNDPCYAAIDLATTSDVSALSLVWKVDGVYEVRNWYFLPEEKVRSEVKRTSSHIYGQLTDMDNVIITEGNVTDYDYIRRLISGYYVEDGVVKHDSSCLADKYNIIDLVYDDWNSSQLMIDLTSDGIRIAPMRQGYKSLSPPTKEVERSILSGALRHDGDPFLRWMMGNVVLERDAAENIKPNKAKSADKIDGVAAMVMAVGQTMIKSKSVKKKLKKDFKFKSF